MPGNRFQKLSMNNRVRTKHHNLLYYLNKEYTMANGLEALDKLYHKSLDVLSQFDNLPEKDIRRKHFEILSSQILVSLVNLRINLRFSETSREEFESHFNNDRQQAENYIYNIIQAMQDNIADVALFQTELAFRFLYSKISGTHVGEEKNLYKIFATLYSDTENNWKKDETTLIVLLWNLRNTVHTGGIYFHKPEGYSVSYKGKEYKFEYGKAPEFLKDGHFMDLVSDLFDSLKYAFSNEPIKSVASFDHPSYYALGY